MAIPAQGVLKPKEFVKQQNNEHIVRFNEAMQTFVRAKYRSVFDEVPSGATGPDAGDEGVIVDVLDWHALSMSAHSFDGTHYGQQVNTLVSQILLNHVAEVLALAPHYM